MARILIVEDEEKIARFVELELTHEGYEVVKAADGRSGVEVALAQEFDLILLDVMLPQLNGVEVLRRVRREKVTPVILLTARDEVMDKVAGLDAGADDYITKPFAIEELLARIRVALKHRPFAPSGAAGEEARGTAVFGRDAHANMAAGANEMAAVLSEGTGGASHTGGLPHAGAASSLAERPGALSVGPVLLDPAAHEVLVDGCAVELTNREFDVLRALMERPNTVLSRDQLVREACGYDYVGDTNVIDVYVSHIRTKLDERFGIELITTVRGVGYVTRTR